ncbi:MAG: putative lipid II flippase FtsW [Acidimicrobiia bacterium]
MSTRTAPKITSITELRAAARARADQRTANARSATTLMVVMAALLVVGLAATTSASSVVGIGSQEDQFFFLKRQLIGVGLGAVALFFTSRISYQLYRKFAMPIFVGVGVLLLAVLVVGEEVAGAQRWIDLGPISLQPSELAKFSVIVALAAVLDKKRRMLGDLGHFLAPVAMFLGGTALLVMLQPDLGTTIVIAVAAMAVMVTSTAPFRFVVGTGFVGGILASILAFSAGYRRDRITGFLDPWADAGGTGWQLIQSYYALGTGGLFGVGLGGSRARWFYLPNAHTDFIFAIIGEETGFVGASMVLALFALFAAAGWTVARRAPDAFGRMVAAGITTWITVQAIVNIGGTLGVMPITGITLPFVSYGGTAIAVTMAAAGVLVNIAHSGGRRR